MNRTNKGGWPYKKPGITECSRRKEKDYLDSLKRSEVDKAYITNRSLGLDKAKIVMRTVVVGSQRVGKERRGSC